MAKEYSGMKKSNSHMNGFGQMDISKGHKHMGKVPRMSEPSANDYMKKKSSKKSEKMEDKSMKTDFDKNMEDSE